MDSFVHGLLNVVDHHFPLRVRRVKQCSYPWMTSEVKAVLNQRNDAYRQMMKSCGYQSYQVNRECYQRLKREFKRVLFQEKKTFFQNNAFNQKKMWNVLSRMMKKDHPSPLSSHITPTALNQY